VEIILHEVRNFGHKILVCAPSNIAVDNVVESLHRFNDGTINIHKRADRTLKLVRVGHPSRMLDSSKRYSLQKLVQNSDEGGLVKDVRTEISVLLRQLQNNQPKKTISRTSSASSSATPSFSRTALYRELRVLKKELKTRERKATRSMVCGADVVLCTLSYTESYLLRDIFDHFDVVIIDEAAQALEVACLGPILRSKPKGCKVILAGDHQQLPPTLKSQEAAKAGLSRTLFDRLHPLCTEYTANSNSKHFTLVTRMLEVQYRMHEKIMTWSSAAMYQNQLVAHSSVKHHVLSQLVTDASIHTILSVPLVLIDTCGLSMFEQKDEESISIHNCHEASIVQRYVEGLVAEGIHAQDIAIITPYSAQVTYIRELLSSTVYSQLEVGSVDGFQGREKEVVVISLVRSNPSRTIGFLQEKRRLNVAITRARRQVVLVCDSETLCSNAFLHYLVDYFQTYACCIDPNHILQVPFHDISTIGEDEHDTNDIKTPLLLRNDSFSNTQPAPADHKPHLSKAQRRKLRSQQKQKEEEMLQLQVSELSNLIKDKLSNDKSSNAVYIHPCNTPAGRRLAHLAAEKLGYQHESQGEGAERYVWVCKKQPTATSDKREGLHTQELIIQNESYSPDISPNVHENTTSPILMRQAASKLNVQHEDRSNSIPARHKRQQKKKAAHVQERRGKQLQKLEQQHVPKAKGKGSNTTKAKEEDLEEEWARAKAGLCFFHACTKKVALIGDICRYCHQKFCFAHCQPEIHGCGAAATAAARKQFHLERLKSQQNSKSTTSKSSTQLCSQKRNELKSLYNEKMTQVVSRRTSQAAKKKSNTSRVKSSAKRKTKRPPQEEVN